MHRRSLAAASAAVAAFVALSPAFAVEPAELPPPVRALQKSALKDQRAYATLKDLTSKVGHRLAGSEGDRKAIAWALATLEAQGFANVRAEPVTVPRWTRGEARVELVGEPMVGFPALALGGSVGTGGKAIEAEVVAATTLAELKALPRERVAGRIVFLYEKMIETRDGMDYGPTVSIRGQGAIEAAKLGAVAVVIRAVGSEDEDRPHTGGMRYQDGVPRIPAFAIGSLSADRLLDRYARGPLRLRVSSTAQCEGTAQSANVIGEITGRGALERGAREEFVVLGAHLDSWDVGTGAQDDGAGVATVIEAARRIGELQERPRRTIRVVLFANEEFGLSGGKQYVLAHEAELDRHAGALEADLGAGRVFRFESKVKADEVPAAVRMADLLAPLGIPFRSNEAGGGADLGPLRDRGVPVFDLQHDASKYFEIHHTAADTIDRVDAKDLAFNVAAYATVAWALAESERRFAPHARIWPEPSDTVHPCEWKP
jgi:hypothetical protein